MILLLENGRSMQIPASESVIGCCGDNEVETNSVSARERGENGDLGSMSVEDFVARVVRETEEKTIKKF